MTTPCEERPFRVVGIDPGTDTIGFSILDLYLSSGRIVVASSETIALSKLLSNWRNEETIHGARTARLMALEERLFIYFETNQIHAVCAESPFLRKFPQTFAALTECMSYIRRAVMAFDRYMPLDVVDPPTAKKAVGMLIKKGATKEDVKNAIRKLGLEFADGVDFEALDEHSVDSIAVAYHQALIYKAQIPT